MLAQGVHSLGQVGTLFFYFSSRFNDLLVENLIAISKICHSRAENHGILIHIDANLTFLSHQFYDGLAVFSFFENFV